METGSEVMEAIPRYEFEVTAGSLRGIDEEIKRKVQPLFFHYEVVSLDIEDSPHPNVGGEYRGKVTVVEVNSYGIQGN